MIRVFTMSINLDIPIGLLRRTSILIDGNSLSISSLRTSKAVIINDG